MIVIVDDDTRLVMHRRTQRAQRGNRIDLIVDVGDEDIIELLIAADRVVFVKAKSQPRKALASELNVLRAEVDAYPNARADSVEEIRRKAADLQDFLPGGTMKRKSR